MVDKDVLEKRLLKLERILRKLKILSEIPLKEYLLVHEYLEVDNKIVYECLQKIEDFKKFATHALTWI